MPNSLPTLSLLDINIFVAVFLEYLPSRYLWQISLSSGKNHQIAANPIITAKNLMGSYLMKKFKNIIYLGIRHVLQNLENVKTKKHHVSVIETLCTIGICQVSIKQTKYQIIIIKKCYPKRNF